MALTSYNNYTITPGRWNPFNSDDLQKMAIADAQIEADFAAQSDATEASGPALSLEEIERKRRKREYNKQYGAANKAKRREYNRRYAEKHPHHRAEYERAYREVHRFEILEQQRARYHARKAKEKQGGTPA